MIRAGNSLLTFSVCLLFAACQAQKADSPASSGDAPYFINTEGDTIHRVTKTDDEWAKELSSQAYYVLREEGTEPAYSGDLWDNKNQGVYVCAACGLPLFSAGTKFESGTGWPSFYQPVDKTHVGSASDLSLGMHRTEVHCNRCGGHLGHVFEDGPKPTGLRYCINSVSLDFEER